MACLTNIEIALAEKALEMAREAGASGCRVTLSKSVLDLAGTLDGALDKVTHCLDRSLAIVLFVDGRYGSFSTNKLEEEALREFITMSAQTVRLPPRLRFAMPSQCTSPLFQLDGHD